MESGLFLISVAESVGRVSPEGVTRRLKCKGFGGDIGLRCANPTYGYLLSPSLAALHYREELA